MREMDKIFFSLIFFMNAIDCAMRHAGESRVSSRIDRIAHPIATFLRMYIGRRTHDRCGGRCENAESVYRSGGGGSNGNFTRRRAHLRWLLSTSRDTGASCAPSVHIVTNEGK